MHSRGQLECGRPRFHSLLLLVASAIAIPTQGAPPNILLVLTDDQGYGDLSINGNSHLRTPNMDRVAMEGARLDRFFVEPVCAPTRAALLSRRYPTRTGVTGVTRNAELMRADEVTLAQLLRERAGYATGCFGNVPYNTPHTPASVPDAEWRRWKDREDTGDEFTRAMYMLSAKISTTTSAVSSTRSRNWRSSGTPSWSS